MKHDTGEQLNSLLKKFAEDPDFYTNNPAQLFKEHSINVVFALLLHTSSPSSFKMWFMDPTEYTEDFLSYLKEKGLRFIGTGVSGGEEGARFGPSIMPGGDPEAWPLVKDIFQAVSAKVDGEPCCQWVGQDGAGHFVKMVHNGIEYGDMQLICEAYSLMEHALGMSCDQMQQVFAEWNTGVLDSYLIDITKDILAMKDEDGEPLVDKILDTAGQKGTGKWTGISALDLGVPLTLIGESVFARVLSSLKDERVRASAILGPRPKISQTTDKAEMINALRDALYASKIISYAQGFMLMKEAAKEYGWNLNYGEIALMWRGGCIIRRDFRPLSNAKPTVDCKPSPGLKL